MSKIRIAINGYGNLGRGVEAAVTAANDLDLVAIFTRRDPESVQTASPVPVVLLDDLENWVGEIDVLVLCGGSATDLGTQGPQAASLFNTVDSFDNHAKIPEYFAQMDHLARTSGHLSLISTGWDPGLFSLQRVIGESVLPDGATYTFWGRGVSQGHSDAVRRVPGVADAVQYTLPMDAAVEAALSGSGEQMSAPQMHTRECFVVLEEGADADEVRDAIVNMPNYFADYSTSVTFITAEELARNHSGMPHGGRVIRSGRTGTNAGHSESESDKQIYDFELALGSNPGFTGSVLTACARAVARLAAKGQTGAISILDVPASALSPRSRDDLLTHMV